MSISRAKGLNCLTLTFFITKRVKLLDFDVFYNNPVPVKTETTGSSETSSQTHYTTQREGHNISTRANEPWKPENLYILVCNPVIFRRVRKIAISGYELRHACPSVPPYGTTRLPLDGFSSNLKLEHSSKTCPENSSFLKIWQTQQALHMKTTRHFYHISLSSSLSEKCFIQKL